jgi:Spherulation-specific family 4
MPKPAAVPWFASFVGTALVASLALGGCDDSAPPLPNSGGSPSGGDTRGVSGTPSNGGGGAARAGQSGAASAGSSAGGAGDGGTSHVGGAEGGLSGNAVAGHTNGGNSSSAGSAGSGGANGAGGLGGSGGQAAVTSGCIVPLYSYPSATAWNAIVQAKQAHPAVNVVAIVNPDSGPGASVDNTFTAGIAKLVAAGIVPIGYISTNYTKRGQAAVKTDTDAWRASYPAVQGIFFDEQSITPGDEAFYGAVADYAKSKGFTLTVGNPGTGVPDSFLGTVDIMLSYESAGTPTLASLQKYAAHRDQFGIIPYATAFDAGYVKAASKSVRYVYLTDDDLPNPWDALPSYFDGLLGALSP